jgi:hypothetical protein
MRAGMMPGLTLCWRLSSAAARAFHVTKSAGACFAAVDPLPLRFLGMVNPIPAPAAAASDHARSSLPHVPAGQPVLRGHGGQNASVFLRALGVCAGFGMGRMMAQRARHWRAALAASHWQATPSAGYQLLRHCENDAEGRWTFRVL